MIFFDVDEDVAPILDLSICHLKSAGNEDHSVDHSEGNPLCF